MKIILVLIGSVATLLGLLGAILPGLPTTPFLLVALWAFARSSERLHRWLRSAPVLQTALQEVERFETERTMRLGVKLLAFSMAWGSAGLTLLASSGEVTWIVGIVTIAALMATAVVIIVPTAR